MLTYMVKHMHLLMCTLIKFISLVLCLFCVGKLKGMCYHFPESVLSPPQSSNLLASSFLPVQAHQKAWPTKLNSSM